MPHPDPRTLLATADAATLREDARYARTLAGMFGGQAPKSVLLRLAALAEAVSALADDCNATIGPAYKRHENRFGCRLQTDRVNAFEDSLLPALATLLPTTTGETDAAR